MAFKFFKHWQSWQAGAFFGVHIVVKCLHCLFCGRALLSGILCCTDKKLDGGSVDHQDCGRSIDLVSIWITHESNVKWKKWICQSKKFFQKSLTLSYIENTLFGF